MMATMLAIVDPGDEVIVFEPFYENYGPDAILSGATPRYVRLSARRAARARGSRTGPSIPTSWPRPSPTGRARSSSTRRTIRPARCSRATSSSRSPRLCQHWDVIAITDEIYEHILYDERRARADGDARRHGRSHGHDQQPVEDLQRDGLARGLDDRAAGHHRRHPQGARLPDGGRGGAAAGGRGGRARIAAGVLPRPGRDLPRRSGTGCCGSCGRPASPATRRRARTTS